MSQTYKHSKIQDAYYPKGNFTDSQTPKFIKAPFQAVTIDGVLYLMPGMSCMSSLAASQVDSDDLEAAMMLGQDYYSSMEPIVVPENRMGDGIDDWIGMHRFGMI
jgi:hypothetical protein